MFAPRQYESKFLHYYLMHRRRPTLIVLMLQGASLPPGYTLAEKYCVVHRMVKSFLTFFLKHFYSIKTEVF